MNEAIKALEAARDKKLAEAEEIQKAINILQTLSAKDAPPRRTYGHKRGYTYKKCGACEAISQVRAASKTCPECGVKGRMEHAKPNDT